MTSSNRLLDLQRRRPAYNRMHSRAADWVTPQAATARELVVLLENGGIDLNLRSLVDGVIDQLPGSSLVSDTMRGAIAARLREWLKQTTDNLLESAELAVNRYAAAQPTHYGAVHVLRNSTATYTELRDRLFAATRAGHVADVLVLTHGSGGFIAADSGIDAARIRGLATEYGGPLNIRSVYMMSCVGASLNGAWLDAGARTSAGTTGDNVLPEPTTHFFWTSWKEGRTFETAVTSAYRRTVDAINEALASIIVAVLPPVVGPQAADLVDVSSLAIIAASRPEVAGAGSLTISSDSLPSPTSAGQSAGLVTTVLPMQVLARLRDPASFALTAARGLSPEGRAFVERWERPLAASGPEGEVALARRIAAAEHLVAGTVSRPLTQQQLDAVICFACGIGKAAFARSTVLRFLNDDLTGQIPIEILKWTKVRRNGVVVENPALLTRRRAEAELFTGTTSGLAVPASREVREYAHQQNPAVAAIGLAEAVEWGLAAGGIMQAGIQGAAGHFNFTFDKAQRLLDSRARLAMPGARAATQRFRRSFLSFPQIRLNAANAETVIEWGGNAYGEMESVVFKEVQAESSDWSISDLRIEVSLLGRVPTGTDPRAWPFTYGYSGRYDPWGNGVFVFEGEIELDAFGGLRWTRPHVVTSRSLSDWFIDGSPEDWVRRGPDVASTVPAIPAEQQAYLREHLPG